MNDHHFMSLEQAPSSQDHDQPEVAIKDDHPQPEVNQTGHAPGSLMELLIVAFPLMISMGSETAMQFIDRMYLSWYSKEAFAAAMPAGVFCWAVTSIPFGVAMYVNAFVAQYYGAKNGEKIVAVMGQGAYIALFHGIVMVFVGLMAGTIFQFVGHASHLQELEAQYFSIMTIGSFPLLLMVTLQGFFSGRGHTKIVMYTNLCELGFNVIFDYLLVLGIAGYYEGMGMRGAAIATVIARILSCLILIYYMWKTHCESNDHVTYDFKQVLKLDFGLLARMYKNGLSSGLQFFVDIAGFAVLMAVIGKLGEVSLTATNLAFQLNSLAFIPAFGIGTALSILVGQRIGEQQPKLAKKTIKMAFCLTIAYMSLWCICYLTIPQYMAMPFLMQKNPDEGYLLFAQQVTEQVSVLLRFVVIYTIFDGMAIIYSSAIRGAGDTRFPVFISTFASVFLLVTPTILLDYYQQATVITLWSVISVFIMFSGVALYARYLSGKWEQMSLIKH